MELRSKVQGFPSGPGVYLMKDAGGKVIYVGKAVDLKKRIAQYFSREFESRYQVTFLMSHVADVDCVVTANEKEALLLEETLIKKYRPRYNLQLKDDKSYVSLMLETTHPFPRLYVTRRPKKDGNLYFGPYPSAYACRQTVDFLQRHFKLRTCSNREFANRSRPCLQYQMGRCDAPCVGWIGEEVYREVGAEVRLFLEGKCDELVSRVETQMRAESEALHFEEAARRRDLIRHIRTTLERQRAVSHAGGDEDYVGLSRQGEAVGLAIVTVRQGRVSSSRETTLKSPEAEGRIVENFLIQYYRAWADVPPSVCVGDRPPSLKSVEEILSSIRGGPVHLRVPRRGAGADLVEIAVRNAQEALRRRAGEVVRVEEVLAALQKRLELAHLPRRIECFDVSNLGGTHAVGAMASFLDSRPDKSRYRRFKIRTKQTPDDFAMMYEILSRRFDIHDEAGRKDEWKRELPDLLVVDGGKGQLAVAEAVLKENHVLGVDVMGLAKPKEDEREDKIFVPGRKDPVRLGPNSSGLFLLQRIRDEAHRFAVTFHRERRRKNTLAKS